jgi:hypothetical protein
MHTLIPRAQYLALQEREALDHVIGKCLTHQAWLCARLQSASDESVRESILASLGELHNVIVALDQERRH